MTLVLMGGGEFCYIFGPPVTPNRKSDFDIFFSIGREKKKDAHNQNDFSNRFQNRAKFKSYCPEGTLKMVTPLFLFYSEMRSNFFIRATTRKLSKELY